MEVTECYIRARFSFFLDIPNWKDCTENGNKYLRFVDPASKKKKQKQTTGGLKIKYISG